MRSSKNRSRSKNNRNRSMGNIVNRVFDSSGPEGKVRGTPQQIIDKYQQLTRDAQLANDRVAAENFQQHGEHYTRMLSAAQREQEARRAEQEAQQQQQREAREARQQAREAAAEAPGTGEQPEIAAQDSGLGDTIDAAQESGLVETPENTPKPKPRRNRRAPKKAQQDAPADAPAQDTSSAAAE